MVKKMRRGKEMIDLDVLLRRINGVITPKQEKEVNEWLAASKKHREYYQRLSNYSSKSIDSLDMSLVPNTTSAFERRLEDRSTRRIFRKVLRYAAVISLPMIVGATLWLFLPEKVQKPISQIKEKAPICAPKVTTQPVLITSSGKSIELKSQLNRSIEEEGGVKIQNISQERLKYQKDTQKVDQQERYNILRTPSGGDYQLELSDGTIIWLNCESEIRYPVCFKKGKRVVHLKGEAFFDVKQNGHPFIVESNGMSIEVLGTRFNVMAYGDEQTIETTLVKGRVKVTMGHDKEVSELILKPGKQAVYNKKNGALDCREVKTELYTGWLDGYFRFENQSLENVMRRICRWYDIRVRFQSPELRNKVLSGKLYRFDDFAVIVNMLEKTTGFKIAYSSKEIIISKLNKNE